MITVSFSTIQHEMAVILLPMIRVSGMFLSMPLLGAKYVPTLIKLGLIVTISLALSQTASVPIAFELFSIQGILAVVTQLLIGILLGFVFQLIMQSFIIAAQLIAMEMGLGFASMVDPNNGVSVPIISQLYILFFSLLFLSMNGHLYLIEMLDASFQHFPVTESPLALLGLDKLPALGAVMFLNSIKIALPALVCLLIINLALGIMTKAAPQLNIFSIGFPITMLFGMVIIWLSILYILPLFDDIVREGFESFDLLVSQEVSYG